MVAATAEKHAEGVEGQEDHRDATECVNFTKAISSMEAIFIASTVFQNIFKVLMSVSEIIRAVPFWSILIMLLVKAALDKLLTIDLGKHLGKLLVNVLGIKLAFKVCQW